MTEMNYTALTRDELIDLPFFEFFGWYSPVLTAINNRIRDLAILCDTDHLNIPASYLVDLREARGVRRQLIRMMQEWHRRSIRKRLAAKDAAYASIGAKAVPRV